MIFSGAVEVGIGTGTDLWRLAGLPWGLGLAGALRFFVRDDHGPSPIRGWWESRTTGPACQEGYRERGSLPNGITARPAWPAWPVAKDKDQASRAKLRCGQGAPRQTRPGTRGARLQDPAERHRVPAPGPPKPSSRDARGPPKAARQVSLALQACTERLALYKPEGASEGEFAVVASVRPRHGGCIHRQVSDCRLRFSPPLTQPLTVRDRANLEHLHDCRQPCGRLGCCGPRCSYCARPDSQSRT